MTLSKATSVYHDWLQTQCVTPGKIFITCCTVNALLCGIFRLRHRQEYEDLVRELTGSRIPRSALETMVLKNLRKVFRRIVWFLKAIGIFLIRGDTKPLIKFYRILTGSRSAVSTTQQQQIQNESQSDPQSTSTSKNQDRTDQQNETLNSRPSTERAAENLKKLGYGTNGVPTIQNAQQSQFECVTPASVTSEVSNFESEIQITSNIKGEHSQSGKNVGESTELQAVVQRKSETKSQALVSRVASQSLGKVTDTQRLLTLIRIAIGPKQAVLFVLHSMNLFIRSFLSIRISELYGQVTAMVVENDWESFLIFCSKFLLFSGMSTLVNAGLRFGEEYIAESMCYRLAQTIHVVYLKHRNYYLLAISKITNRFSNNNNNSNGRQQNSENNNQTSLDDEISKNDVYGERFASANGPQSMSDQPSSNLSSSSLTTSDENLDCLAQSSKLTTLDSPDDNILDSPNTTIAGSEQNESDSPHSENLNPNYVISKKELRSMQSAPIPTSSSSKFKSQSSRSNMNQKFVNQSQTQRSYNRSKTMKTFSSQAMSSFNAFSQALSANYANVVNSLTLGGLKVTGSRIAASTSSSHLARRGEARANWNFDTDGGQSGMPGAMPRSLSNARMDAESHHHNSFVTASKSHRVGGHVVTAVTVQNQLAIDGSHHHHHHGYDSSDTTNFKNNVNESDRNGPGGPSGGHQHGHHHHHVHTGGLAFNADKRIAEDVLEFTHQIVHLFGHTLKPIMDVIMSSISLFSTLGFQSPMLLYSYFVINGLLIGYQTPPFSRLGAAEQSLHNDYLQAHTRVVSHAEEIAFLQGERQEYRQLDSKLKNLLHFKTSLRIARFRQNLLDQWTIKYCASIIGMSAISFPLMLQFKDGLLSKAELISRHRTADNLIRHAAGAIGEIILVYHQVNSLFTYGLRISEILEKTNSFPKLMRQNAMISLRGLIIDWINPTGWFDSALILLGLKDEFGEDEPRQMQKQKSKALMDQVQGPARSKPKAPGFTTEDQALRTFGANLRKVRLPDADNHLNRVGIINSSNLYQGPMQLPDRALIHNYHSHNSNSNAGTNALDNIERLSPKLIPQSVINNPEGFVRFANVTIYNPEGKLLVRNLDITVRLRNNILVSGPNGCGKTSLFRCLSGLWRPRYGQIIVSGQNQNENDHHHGGNFGQHGRSGSQNLNLGNLDSDSHHQLMRGSSNNYSMSALTHANSFLRQHSTFGNSSPDLASLRLRQIDSQFGNQFGSYNGESRKSIGTSGPVSSRWSGENDSPQQVSSPEGEVQSQRQSPDKDKDQDHVQESEFLKSGESETQDNQSDYQRKSLLQGPPTLDSSNMNVSVVAGSGVSLQKSDTVTGSDELEVSSLDKKKTSNLSNFIPEGSGSVTTRDSINNNTTVKKIVTNDNTVKPRNTNSSTSYSVIQPSNDTLAYSSSSSAASDNDADGSSDDTDVLEDSDRHKMQNVLENDDVNDGSDSDVEQEPTMEIFRGSKQDLNRVFQDATDIRRNQQLQNESESALKNCNNTIFNGVTSESQGLGSGAESGSHNTNSQYIRQNITNSKNLRRTQTDKVLKRAYTFLGEVFGGTTVGEETALHSHDYRSRRGRSQIFYLPQSPYICTGSLLDNIWYPLRTRYDQQSHKRIVELFKQVGLESHLPQLEHVNHDWRVMLSGGERQKLSFARLLFHQPEYAALDEATSAVSQDVQENLYRLLSESNTTYFSIAHRPEIKKFHQSELRIFGDGNGGWSIEDIKVEDRVQQFKDNVKSFSEFKVVE